MADLVNQIFKQSQLAAGIGTGLGEFFSAGVRSRQADRQLNLSEQRNQLMTKQVRLDNIRTGLAIEKQQALEANSAAEEQAELELAQRLARINVSEEGWSRQNPDVVSGWNLLTKANQNSPVVKMFLDGLSNADALERLDAFRNQSGFTPSSLTLNTTAGSATIRPKFTQEQTIEASDKLRSILGQDAVISVDESGIPSGRSASGSSSRVITIGPNGEPLVVEGQGAMDQVRRRQLLTARDKLDTPLREINNLVSALDDPDASKAFGVRGVTSKIRNSFLSQINPSFFDEEGEEIRMKARVIREVARAAIIAEKGQLSNQDNARIERIFPNPDEVFESLPEARSKAKEVQRIVQNAVRNVDSRLGRSTAATETPSSSNLSFATEAAALEAQQRGEIKQGDTVIINGQTFRWVD